ncbi:DUF4142 domain-containing protein [Pseudaminobacter soli (ex Li et al. 2025)]|uniref:DUF4142 domain-containing protein n=1 Tax=Pseudaminobacter soli (ex Li et al. 2025) TaxID=1295366 RepID=A0A2P7S178_9HYPH|nr:hypothetical protein C7I85_24925 [Mesorhizobium soli]
MNPVFGGAPSTQDFVTDAATSDMFEIESSELALERSDAATKAFAQQMIKDHAWAASSLALIALPAFPPCPPAAISMIPAKLRNFGIGSARSPA